MKNLILGIALTTSSLFAAEISILSQGKSLKVATISTIVKCVESDFWADADDASYKCKTKQVFAKIAKELNGKIIDVNGLDKTSREVLSNNVDDEKRYKVNFEVLYY